jgi:hypothetical protein
MRLNTDGDFYGTLELVRNGSRTVLAEIFGGPDQLTYLTVTETLHRQPRSSRRGDQVTHIYLDELAMDRLAQAWLKHRCRWDEVADTDALARADAEVGDDEGEDAPGWDGG